MGIAPLARIIGQRAAGPCLLAGTALLLASAGTAAVSGTPAVASAAVGPPVVTVKPCIGKKVTGPFVVRGAQVYSDNGKSRADAATFLSYGVTVANSLEKGTWPTGKLTPSELNARVAGDEQRIAWSADDWCANTIRIQVNQDLLFGNGTTINRGYAVNRDYLEAIEAEVTYAVHDKLVVVLNDSTESAVHGNSQVMPTSTTFMFWKVMSGIYGRVHGPGGMNGPAHVIFDLFNEPRYRDSTWPFWYYGDAIMVPPPPAGDFYFGMEQLATFVRRLAPNLFWIEGPDFSDSFIGLDTPGMFPNYLITAGNVVYAIHHPLAATETALPDNPTVWNLDFGYLVRDGIAPVVVGEWTNHELGKGAGVGNSACWTDAPTQVKVFLEDYLARYGIGLSAYTLSPGYLLRTEPHGKADPLQPSTINPSVWTCKPSGGPYSGQEGAGYPVYQFFREGNAAS
jgi:hypothetical protein